MKGVEPRAMMSQMFGKATGLSKGRDSALHSGVSELGIFGNTSMLGANLPVAAGLGLHLQDGEDRQRRRRVLRRGRQQYRRFSRGAEFRRRPAAADHLRLREQSLRLFGAGRKEHGDRRRGGPGGELRLRRRLDQRQRRAGGLSVDSGRARARAQRRGSDTDRVQDVPMARPLRARQGVLSDRRRAGDVEEPRPDSDVHDLSAGPQRAERRQAEGNRRPRDRRRSTTRWSLR